MPDTPSAPSRGAADSTRRGPRSWLRPVTLRARILVATAALAAVALVLAVGAFGVALDRILYSSATTTAADQAAALATDLAAPGARADDVLGRVATHGSLIQVLDASGRVVAATEESLAHDAVVSTLPGPGSTTRRQVVGLPDDPGDPYAVVARGLEDATADGGRTVVVASPLQGETRLVKGAVVALAVLALSLLVGLLLLIDRVLRRALGRVEDVRSSVDAVRAAGSGQRVAVPPGDDEISRLAVTMNSMLDRLDRADAAQRQFVSNASHELRSPLTTIRAVTEISPGGLDAEGTAVVAAEALRMQALVDDLLTLAKTDDDGLALAATDVDLDEIVLAQARRVRLSTGLAADVFVGAARVTGDPARLDQVVHNLVDNAVRHATTTVRLRCAVEDGVAVVRVDNDGPPVPEDDRERVFERFARLQDSRDRDSGGSGLGLAIVRALVTAHGGRVRATVADDGWCRFEVTLPAQPDEWPDDPDDALAGALDTSDAPGDPDDAAGADVRGS